MSDTTLGANPMPAGPRARSKGVTHALVFAAVTAVAAAVAVALILHAGLSLAVAVGVAMVLHLLLFSLHLKLASPSSPTVSTAGTARRAQRTEAAPAARDKARPEPQLATPQSTVASAARIEQPPTSSQSLAQPAAQTAEGMASLPPLDLRSLLAPGPEASAARAPLPTLDAPQETGADAVVASPNPVAAAAFDEILRDLARTLETHGHRDVPTLDPLPQPASRAAPQPAIDPAVQEQLLATSVAALRSTSEAMQAYEQQIERRPAPVAEPKPTAAAGARTPSQMVLEELADAIEQERVELALSPIPGLADQRLHHHELIMRLATASGGVPVPQGISSAARGTGLVPLLDALKVSRAVKVAQSFQAAGETGAVFCRATGEGLMSKRLARALSGDADNPQTAATRVVLSFVHHEVRAFGHAHWTTLADLADQGFRFAVEEVTDLDLDFPGLRNVGFMFAKMSGSQLLQGLPLRDGIIPPVEVNRYLASAGITLVVDHIDDEALIGPLRSCGAPLGQGLVFGSPRTVTLGGGRVAA
ncbi:MAG: EAL domain-containing protein [Hyphomicrobiaceae bacterium]